MADASQPEAVRSQALAGLASFHHLIANRGPASRPSALETTLLALWNDPKADYPAPLLNQLDYALRVAVGPSFDTSPQRAKVWLRNLLTPSPANLAPDPQRDNLALFIFRELMQRQPQLTGPQLVRCLADERWPIGFRRGAALALLLACEQSDAPDPSWVPALQAHYAAVMQSDDIDAIRIGAIDLAAVPSGKGPVRPFVADDALRVALHAQEDALRKQSADKTNPYARVAADDVQRALAAIASTKPVATTAP